jgi:maltose/moltooligosaccharide transporter
MSRPDAASPSHAHSAADINLADPKPDLSLPQIANMSFGFLGIQFGWGLQMANMSAIYGKLGAEPDKIPLLWLAAPMTGLIVQPIIGSLSDRTWTWLGRRRPYFLVGAILASIALFIMPDVTALWMAATLLWVLDASINVSMEPFRAFVADKLNTRQRTLGFVMQSFFIGLGATLANMMPYLLTQIGVTGNTPSGIPLSVQISFKVGAAAFFLAVLWTVLTSREYPPQDLEAFRRENAAKSGVAAWFQDIAHALRDMPRVMKQLAVVQVATWLGLFCMWMFFSLTVARHVFRAVDEQDPAYDRGTEWGGVCFAVYSVVCFLVAFALPWLAAKIGRKTVHALCLAAGGLGLLAVGAIRDPNLLLLSMVGVGIAWASILSMPYAILSGSLPAQRMGLYMGVFNFFIVIPEIVAALTFQPLVKNVFGNDPLKVVLLGGACLILAALLMLFVQSGPDRDVPESAVLAADATEPFELPEAAQPVPSTGLEDGPPPRA